jgi:Membrane bound O-acyl transferase family
MSTYLLAPVEWPRWAQMWTLALAIYTTCKWLTWLRTPIRHVPAWKHVAYLLAWPGMDAASFLAAGHVSNRSRCRSIEWLAATLKLMLGVALLFGVARRIPPQQEYVRGWIGMIGIVLILHFGVFHLLSCLWRSAGVEARALMNRPLASTSLSEFWGRRWNTAFRDLTHRFLFRPCASWFGPRWGIVAGFLFSGAIHDLVISVPARGGYGGPTVFFAIQGAAMVVERGRFGRRTGLGSGWPGRLFAIAVLIAPAGWLFHRPFVVGIIVPFMQVVGAV